MEERNNCANTEQPPKGQWEAPDIRSLEDPAINGGTLTATPEAFHAGGSQNGTLS